MPYNAGLLYYRHYYSDIDFATPEAERVQQENGQRFYERHKTLFSIALAGESLFPDPGRPDDAFELTTAGAGLLLGSGYAHGSGLLGEMKIGFFFDHTTGLPVIPGSSVKGVLRSAFPGPYRKAAQKHRNKAASAADAGRRAEESRFAEQLEYKARLAERFIAKLLAGYLARANPPVEVNAALIEQIENELFGRTDAADNGLPMSGRDVFHDAVPVRSQVPERVLRLEKVSESEQERERRRAQPERLPAGAVFADDFITPHKNRKNDGFPDAVKNPVPISFLKVLPGVTFRFQFDLKDSQAPGGLNAAQKRDLFKQILLFSGVGAKTNTGYGHFSDPLARAEAAVPGAGARQQAGSPTPAAPGTPAAPITAKPTGLVDFTRKVKQGEELIARVVAVGKPFGTVEIMVKGEVYTAQATGNLPDVGIFIKVKINVIDSKTQRIKQVGLIGLWKSDKL